MQNSDVAIAAEHVTKIYKLGVFGSTTLKKAVQSKIATLRGKEDPNTKIGAVKDSRKFVTAVDDVSFTIKKGERIGILGKNGAGKSTLLKLISRVTTPTEGFIGYNGKLVSMLQLGIGFNEELTGEENVYLNGAILGMTRDEVRSKYDDIVAFSEIGDFMDTPVKRYSSGMFIRLGFAVASHLAADIVIMDEVLAVGDVQFREKCIKKMRAIAEEENKTIIYVSHHMDTVNDLCNRCFVMNEGRLIYEGDVDEAERIYRSQ